MAKRVRTEIDEEAIRRMMSGDVPRLGDTPPTGRTMPTSADKNPESGTASASQEAVATADSENPEKRESQTGQLQDSPDITAKATPTPEVAELGSGAPVSRKISPSVLPDKKRAELAPTKNEGTSAESTAEEGDNSRVRKRAESRTYTKVYLHRRAPELKRQTYISDALYTKLTDILAVIARGLTVPAFIDNVLVDHLEQYRDEINELYEIKTRKPL